MFTAQRELANLNFAAASDPRSEQKSSLLQASLPSPVPLSPTPVTQASSLGTLKPGFHKRHKHLSAVMLLLMLISGPFSLDLSAVLLLLMLMLMSGPTRFQWTYALLCFGLCLCFMLPVKTRLKRTLNVPDVTKKNRKLLLLTTNRTAPI